MRKNVAILFFAFVLVIILTSLVLTLAKDKTCEPWHFWAEGCLDKWQTLWAGILSLIAAFIGVMAILWQTRVQIQTAIESEARAAERARSTAHGLLRFNCGTVERCPRSPGAT